jgi:hypothetical protein
MDPRLVHLAQDLVLDVAEGDVPAFHGGDGLVPDGEEEGADVSDALDGMVLDDQVDREHVVGVDPVGELPVAIQATRACRAELGRELLPFGGARDRSVVDAGAHDVGDGPGVSFQEPVVEVEVDLGPGGGGAREREQGQGQGENGATLHDDGTSSDGSGGVYVASRPPVSRGAANGFGPVRLAGRRAADRLRAPENRRSEPCPSGFPPRSERAP